MTTILSEGVIVPDVGDVNWAGKLEVNWNLLNGALANLSGNVKLDRDNTWTGAQSFTLPIVGSITGTASKAIADEDGTSIKTGYVNVAGNQTVTGDKSFTGSNTFNNILPNATNTYSLGSSSYQWSSVYAQTYYYNGTAWGLDKANTWTNTNTFSNTLKQANSTITKGTNPQSDINAFSVYWGGTSVSSLTNALFTQRGVVNADGSTAYILYALENVLGGTHTSLSLRYDPNDTINKRSAMMRGDFRPYYDNSFNLGTSTNKWKTLNGINPGALGMPDASNSVKVDITDWVVPGNNNYTPALDGWLCVITKDTATSSIFIYSSSLAGNRQYAGSVYGNGSQGSGRLSIMLPVRANVQYTAVLRGDSASDIYSVIFFPCLGNV